MNNFECKKGEEWCGKVKKYLEEELPKEVFTLEAADDWTQPQAARQLLGLIKYLNHFAESEFETFHALKTENTLGMFFNCKVESVREALAEHVPRDEVKFGASQNLMDNMGIPHQQLIDPKQLFDEHEEVLSLFVPELQFRFVREPELIEQLDTTQI